VKKSIGGKEEKFYRDILLLCKEKYNIDSGSLFLAKRKYLYLVAGIGRTKRYIGTKIHFGERISGYAFSKNEILYLEDGLQNYENFKSLAGIKDIVRSYVIPLRSDNKVLGLLTLNKEEERKETVLDNGKKEFFEDISHLIGLALKIFELSHRTIEAEKKLHIFLESYENNVNTFLHEITNSINLIDQLAEINYKNGRLARELYISISSRMKLINTLSNALFLFKPSIENLLEFYPVPVSMTIFFEKLRRDFEEICQVKSINCGIHIENGGVNDIAFVDISKLHIVLMNILHNALKYTRSSVEVVGSDKGDGNVLKYL